MKFYDPLYGAIDVQEPFDAIVNSAWFRRLQHLRQLGLCYLSFPGGNHSRFEHSLGAYHLATTAATAIRYGSALSRERDRQRLAQILKLSLLCHDIGHGPFSHMMENILLGLGFRISHEEVGAAIVAHKLASEFNPFVKKWEITPSLIAHVVTKGQLDDDQARAAVSLTSGDLDLDRLDYLYRDSRYAGVAPHGDAAPSLENIWSMRRVGEDLYLELTDAGVAFAEATLFLRRNNYQRIVYESRHMAATAMFEKAVHDAVSSGSLGSVYGNAAEAQLKWADPDSVASEFDKVWALFGLVDYSLLALLRRASYNCRYLTHRIQRGKFYDSVARFTWPDLHYLTKQTIAGMKDDKSTFLSRRRFEGLLANKAGVADIHVAVHLPRMPSPRPFTGGVEDGRTFGERSALGAFLHDDAIRQYAIEIYVDPSVDAGSRHTIKTAAAEVMQNGNVGELRENAH